MEFESSLLFGSVLVFAAAGLLLALVLRSARLISKWGHVVLITSAWPIGMVTDWMLRGFFYGMAYVVAGLALGAATFWALSKSNS